jgi:WD40 repeat protein
VIADREGTFSLWDVAARQELLKYKLPGRELQAMDVSGDGKLIAATTMDGVYLWPWLAGDQPVKLPIDARRAMAVRFSPSGKLLAIGGGGRIGAWLWDLKAAKVVHTLRSEGDGSSFYTLGLAFTPDGKFLAVPGERDKKAILFLDAESGKEVRRFDTAPFEPRRLAISRDGQWLASTGLEQKVNVWNLRTGEEMGREAIGHKASIQGVQFSPDGKNVVTASDDGTIRIWDAASGRQQKVLQNRDEKQPFAWVRGIALSPDGKWIASNSLDNTVRLWDMATGREVYRLPGHGSYGGRRPVAFTSDSRRLCTWGDQDALLRVWDVATGKAIAEFAVHPSDVKSVKDDVQTSAGRFDIADWKHGVSEAAFSPDGRLFVLSYLRTGYIFDIESGKEVQKVALSTLVRCLAISPDRNRVAVVVDADEAAPQRLAGGGTRRYPPQYNLMILSLPSGKKIWKQPAPDGFYGQVSFSPVGKYLVAAMRSPDSQIRIVESSTGKSVYTIQHVPRISWTHSLALSPDGKRLACGMDDTSVLIWDLPQSYR